MSILQRPLDLVIVTETYPPEVNGVAMTIARLVDGLRAAGHRVRIVRPRQPADREDPGDARELLVRGLPLPGYAGLRFGLPAYARLSAAWRAARPDVVHVVTEGPLGAAAVSAARALGIPVTSGFHTNFDRYSRHYGFGFLQPLVAAYLRRFHRRTRLTLVPTAALADSLASAGLPGVRVVGRGVDCTLFDPARRSHELRATWGLTAPAEPVRAVVRAQAPAAGKAQGEFDLAPPLPAEAGSEGQAAVGGLVVLYVGRLAAEKNVELVLRAFAAIRAHRRDARLVLVGDGPLRARLARNWAGEGAPGSSASAAIHFAGQRCGEDLAAHYASGDLFLFPSLTETFGNVTQEAMASGLAVLAFRSAAAAELIVDGENGRTVAPGDEAAFIGAAVQLAKEDAIRRRLGRRARQSVRERDWSGVAAHFADTLRAAVVASVREPQGEFGSSGGKTGGESFALPPDRRQGEA